MLLASNDSWFFDSAAVYQHQAQAQLRAIETGRYVVRAANTGITALISPRGEVIDSLAPLCEGVVIGEVYAREGQTLYACVGNLFVYLCMIALSLPLAKAAFGGLCRAWERRKKELSSPENKKKV